MKGYFYIVFSLYTIGL
jgi:hypothetical protein